jgi:predicted SprT family Zn-dependent metalloprotease
MAGILDICPVCTEYETNPKRIKHSLRLGNKFVCEKCKAEFWLKVTKEPDYKYFDKKI